MDLKRPTASGAAASTRLCWCGGECREPLRADYARCVRCGTVVYTEPFDPGEYTATGPESFYGERYWRHYVPERLGLPSLEQRARTDLAERAVFHLERILEHLEPGQRVLELGSGAGCLVYLLGEAGFEATGVELSAPAIALARDRFDVETRLGPLETLALDEPVDAIVAIDLLEHLPHPLATVEACAGALAPDGLLFVQTPCYREQGAEWEMLLPSEHLHLFTESALQALLGAAGFDAVETRASLFPHDVWATAARRGPLARRPEPIEDGVAPIAVALIDAYRQRVEAEGELAAVEDDRRRKDEAIDWLDREVAALRADQGEKETALRRQDAEIDGLRRDQRGKQALIERLSAELGAVRADQTAKGALIERLSAEVERLGGELEAIDEDRAAKDALIERLSAELVAVRADHAARGALIAEVDAELRAVREDQQAKEAVIGQLVAERAASRAELAASRADLATSQDELATSQDELAESRAELDDLRRRPAARFERFLRRFLARSTGRHR